MKKRYQRFVQAGARIGKPAAFLMLLALSFGLTACAAENLPETERAAETSELPGTQSGGAEAPGTEGAQSGSEQAEMKDNYYKAVNGELLAGWEIEPDENSKSWFSILDDQVKERMTGLIQEISEGTEFEKGSDESNIRALYLTGMDEESRNQNGFGETVSAFFEKVDAAETVDELLRTSMQFGRDYGMFSVFGLSIGSDYENSSVKMPVMDGGDCGLQREIWFSDDESNQKHVSAYEKYLRELCMIEGYSETEADAVVQDTVSLMKVLAEKSLSQADLYDPSKTYHLFTISEVEELFSGKVTSEMIEEIFGIGADEQAIVSQPEKVRTMGEMLTEENLPMLKQYVKLCAHKDLSMYLDMESYAAYTEYQMTAMGNEEETPFEEAMISSVQNVLGFECGRLYCGRYYSEETTENVASIVDQVIRVFGQRIDALDWMGEETKEEAKKKLESLDVRIGHPETWPQDRYEVLLDAPEENGTYIDNYLKIHKAAVDYEFATRNEPVDKTLWPDTPQTINAYYDPSNNSINILAGILQAPFYDPEASIEENLGGIGAVIGHEITHAFDNNGAMYDEQGNLRDWWTQEDRESFQSLAEQVIAYYDGMEVNGKQVNGEQTVSENIADLGGVSCITEIAEAEGYDLEQVYESYATIWASKAREEYLSMLIAIDVHSPDEIRVNAVLSAQPEFRELYGIEEGDGMYEESMPEIW
mgnify:CR=1 FL=1